MNSFEAFSTQYANGVTAVASLLALALTFFTLLYVKREYENKYRPYVVPHVAVVHVIDSKTIFLAIQPRNAGSHPCEVRITKIRLKVGDETYETPDVGWMLSAPSMGFQVPAGHINEQGIENVRGGKYRHNRIALTFVLHTRAADGRFATSKESEFEVNVEGEQPVVLSRTEWHKMLPSEPT